ncbi:MAG: hypothetical protein K0S65_4885 [Labilithrix sp.]|nr:hypothetical protein [Labilithrix sp.]
MSSTHPGMVVATQPVTKTQSVFTPRTAVQSVNAAPALSAIRGRSISVATQPAGGDAATRGAATASALPERSRELGEEALDFLAESEEALADVG